MNPRSLSSSVVAAAVLPGDIVVHPVDGFTKRVEAVSRAHDRVTLSFRSAEALRLSRDSRVRLL